MSRFASVVLVSVVCASVVWARVPRLYPAGKARMTCSTSTTTYPATTWWDVSQQMGRTDALIYGQIYRSLTDYARNITYGIGPDGYCSANPNYTPLMVIPDDFVRTGTVTCSKGNAQVPCDVWNGSMIGYSVSMYVESGADPATLLASETHGYVSIKYSDWEYGPQGGFVIPGNCPKQS